MKNLINDQVRAAFCVVFILSLLAGFVVQTPAQDVEFGPNATVVTFVNSSPITINDNSTASPYPSQITVSGVNPAIITNVQVELIGFSHTFPDDVDIVLVGPQGQRAVLMSDAGAGGDVANLDLKFNPTEPNPIPDTTTLTTGFYRPANYELPDNFPAPGPGILTDATADLGVFNLTDPNGVWRLYVLDDQGTDVGSIGQWFLRLTVPQVFLVNSVADTSDGVCNVANCTLREAITAAQSGDLINFGSFFHTGPNIIALQNALPDITQSITINGPGANLLTVRRDVNASNFRIFNITGSSGGVGIHGMTVANGKLFDSGGGIKSTKHLTLTGVHVTENSGNIGAGVSLQTAGGVFTGCTFSSNSSNSQGGGIYHQGVTGSVLRIVNSTVSGNSDRFTGGGIINDRGRLEVVNSTIASNTSEQGLAGGITTTASVSNAATTLRNTIVASNGPSNFAEVSTNGGIASIDTLGFNLSENFNGVFTTLGTDITSTQSRLARLAFYGGQTPTRALLHGSAAINVGDASGSSFDQRGANRVFGGTADIGAVEMRPLVVTNANNSGGGSLRLALDGSIGQTPFQDIQFESGFFSTPRTIALASQLTIFANVNIIGTSENDLTISGENTSRVFEITSGFTASLSGMKISGGNVAAAGGGVWNNGGTAYIANSNIIGNTAGTNGGGIFNFGRMVVTGTTFSDNTANAPDGGGGGIATSGSSTSNLTVSNSGFFSNMATNNGTGSGGAIMHFSGVTRISNSVISANTAGNGGGIRHHENFMSVTNTTLSGNNAPNGGGISNNLGTLNVLNTTISNSTAANGGGISNATGTVNVANSTISGNTASGSAGGILNGGTLNMTNSTVSGNTGGNSCGGICSSGTASLTSSTITDNTLTNPAGASGVFRVSGTITFRNSIVAANVANNVNPDVAANGGTGVTSNGYNLIGNRGTINFGGTGDQSGTGASPLNPRLGELQDNGGPTHTHALLGGSPALDKGESSGSGIDQRVLFRPFNILSIDPAPGGDHADIGAFEAQTAPSVSVRSPFDYDGDGKTDISIFRPAQGEWWIYRSSNSSTFAAQFGASSDKIIPADYTGDGKTDVAFWRPSTGQWFVLRSEDSSFFAFPFGTNGDVPIPGDYDGDGKADAAIFRPSSLTWFINRSSGGTDIVTFGAAGDKPVVADYDGDAKADIAICRTNGANTEWWIRRSSTGAVFAAVFGTPTDKAVQGDYTGDGKADVAFWRPSNGNWFVLRSEDFSFFAFPFGGNGDVPVPGDYDADGRTDAAVFRPSSFNWFIQRSTAGTLIQQFGIAGDIPTPGAYVP